MSDCGNCHSLRHQRDRLMDLIGSLMDKIIELARKTKQVTLVDDMKRLRVTLASMQETFEANEEPT